MREAFDIISSGSNTQLTCSSSSGNNSCLQMNLPKDPVLWLTDFADTIDQHKKSTEAALDFSDQMQEAVTEDIKGIKSLKTKISEQYDMHKKKGYSLDQDRERLTSLKTDMIEREKTLTAAKTRKEAALAMFEKAKKELEQATFAEQEIESKVVAERHELATLERRVLRFGVALAEGMEYCNSKIDDANRKIRLAKALEEYSIKARKHLLENVCNENDGALIQLVKRVHAFVKDITNRGERLNMVALKYAVQLLCKAWGESEGSSMPDVVMKAIQTINDDLFQPENVPSYSLSLSKTNFDQVNHAFKTVVFYHRAVYLHTNHHVEQTKRVVNCLKFLKDNQRSSSKSVKNVFEIEEIDLLSTDHIPSARVLRLVHAGSYLKRVHDIAEGTYMRTSEDVKDTAVAINTSTSTDKSKEEENEEYIAEMEASDDEFIAFDVGTSLLSTEDKVKTDAFWKLLDADDETKHSNDRHISGQRSSPSNVVNGETSHSQGKKRNQVNRTKRHYTNRRTSALGIADMLELNIIKAGPIKIVYRGEVIKHGTVNEDSSFSAGKATFDTPSGFALHYIRKLANPNISTISGYMAIYQGKRSLDALRKAYLSTNPDQRNLVSGRVKTEKIGADVNELLDAKIKDLQRNRCIESWDDLNSSNAHVCKKKKQ